MIVLCIILIYSINFRAATSQLQFSQNQITNISLSEHLKKGTLHQYEIVDHKINGEMVTEGDYAYLNKVDVKIIKDIENVNLNDPDIDLEKYFKIETNGDDVQNSIQSFGNQVPIDDIYLYFSPSSILFSNQTTTNYPGIMMELCCNSSNTDVSGTNFVIPSIAWSEMAFTNLHTSLVWYFDCFSPDIPCSRIELSLDNNGTLLFYSEILREGSVPGDPSGSFTFAIQFLQQTEFKIEDDDELNYLLILSVVAIVIIGIYWYRRRKKKNQEVDDD